MRGIIGYGGYVPLGRLDLSTVAAIAGAGGRQGTRAVAAYDEDATTMAVEASRVAWHAAGDVGIHSLWFATVSPPYLDRTNATAIHAALALPESCGAYDVIGSVRGAMGALRAAAAQPGGAMAVAADVRTGFAGGPDEAYFGDGAAALVLGDDGEGDVVADIGPWVSKTAEFVDRWRRPTEERSRIWEERFGEVQYAGLAADTLDELLKSAELAPADVDHLIITGTHGRACRAAVQRSGFSADRVVDDLSGSVGNTGAAHPFLLLSSVLEHAQPGQTIVLLVLADGAEALLVRTTTHVTSRTNASNIAGQVKGGRPLSYGRYLAWRGILPVEPPRRPEPARTSSSAAGRSVGWKFGFEGSLSPDGSVHLPPLPDEGVRHPMADAMGTVRTFTVDRLSYSQNPPLVFAVVDFDGGGRLPIELTHVDPDNVRVGDRVEMTFRRLATADGIHNYFWKARPYLGGRD